MYPQLLGVLSPDKGFARNDAGMSHWIGEKGEQAIKARLSEGRGLEIIGKRIQLLKGDGPERPWEYKEGLKATETVTPANAKGIIQKQVNTNGLIFDFSGSPVFTDADYLIDQHIKPQNFDARKASLSKIQEILKNPQEVWGQFEKYPNGRIVFSKKYFANINGKPFMLVAEYTRGRSGMPVLTTLYNVDAKELIKKRTGMRLDK